MLACQIVRRSVSRRSGPRCGCPSRRSGYYSTTSSTERVPVACGGNGEIYLDIFHPTVAASPHSGPSTVILYLPQGPLLESSKDDTANLTALRSRLQWPVVQLNYRLSKSQPYPTPIHDVLAGYDWVREHLLPKRAIARTGRPSHVGRIAVAGELIGGGLAAMLALTECRKGEPGVVAAMLNRPLVNWTGLEQNVTQPSRSPTSDSLTASNILKARDQYFPKPATYFDSFASPMLFFRTAGMEPPKTTSSVLDDLAQLSMLDREDFHREQALLSGVTQDSLRQAMSSAPVSATPMKRATRLFPSKGFNLELPNFHISADNTSPLFGQADELSQVLKKSMVRQRKARMASSSFGRKVLMDDEQDELDEDERLEKLAEKAEADEKVQFHSSPGSGSWQTSGLDEAIGWLKEKLG